MTERIFDIRLDTTYEGAENNIATLYVGILQDGEWVELFIDALSPGFLLLNYGLCSCQHLYFRTNAAECGLQLEASSGRVKTVADEDWHIQSIDIQFDGILRSGDVTQQHIDYIIERMGHCPVSTNMVKPASQSTRVFIRQADE